MPTKRIDGGLKQYSQKVNRLAAHLGSESEVNQIRFRTDELPANTKPLMLKGVGLDI